MPILLWKYNWNWGSTFALECPLCNSILIKFPPLVHNLLLGNLKVFFQSDCQVAISPLDGENQQLVIDEPIEFQKQPMEFQDFGKTTHRFRQIYRICLTFMEKKPTYHIMVTSWTWKHYNFDRLCPKISPDIGLAYILLWTLHSVRDCWFEYAYLRGWIW